jgi:hypothetical protein
LYEERKDEGAREVDAGRVAELRKLEASERALADALCAYARSAAGGGQMLHLAERHFGLAELLAQRIVALGGRAEVDADDLWIIGPPEELDTIVYAEQAAVRAYHDHLLDLDPETMLLVRDRILPAHEDTLEALTGERSAEELTLEYG